MALRVLLADESTTIKKVMQLALQDFAVEVKSVHSGLDVAEVARAFKPDIIFADVLLQKKNGYEVSAELKKDPALKTTPLVLMWSSFMNLDEKQATLAQPDRRLEKPFDVEHLRQIVLELVPKTRSQKLAPFLQFPSHLTQPLRDEVMQKAPKTPPPLPAKPEPAKAAVTTETPPPVAHAEEAPDPLETEAPTWNMESFDDIGSFTENESTPDSDDADDEAFSELRILPQMTQTQAIDFGAVHEDNASAQSVAPSDDGDPWSHQDLSRFKLDLDTGDHSSDAAPDVTIDFGDSENTPSLSEDSSVELELPPADGQEMEMIDFSSSESAVAIEESELDEVDLSPSPSTLSTDKKEELLSHEAIPSLNADQLERIVRAQSREIIESVVRRIVPDLATQIIRAELERLLEEPSTEKQP